ncbi:MAG: hypothetical protein WBX19_23165, partial [Terracidiphilus sp.]
MEFDRLECNGLLLLKHLASAWSNPQIAILNCACLLDTGNLEIVPSEWSASGPLTDPATRLSFANMYPTEPG